MLLLLQNSDFEKVYVQLSVHYCNKKVQYVAFSNFKPIIEGISSPPSPPSYILFLFKLVLFILSSCQKHFYLNEKCLPEMDFAHRSSFYLWTYMVSIFLPLLLAFFLEPNILSVFIIAFIKLCFV